MGDIALIQTILMCLYLNRSCYNQELREMFMNVDISSFGWKSFRLLWSVHISDIKNFFFLRDNSPYVI